MNTLKTLALQTPKKALGVIVDIPAALDIGHQDQPEETLALQTPKKALGVIVYTLRKVLLDKAYPLRYIRYS